MQKNGEKSSHKNLFRRELRVRPPNANASKKTDVGEEQREGYGELLQLIVLLEYYRIGL